MFNSEDLKNSIATIMNATVVVVVVWFGDSCKSPGALLLTAAPFLCSSCYCLMLCHLNILCDMTPDNND